MVVHINGRMLTFFGVEGSSASDVDGNKLAPEQFTGQFRLYPGVDALATNGLRYGAIVEIRQNFIGQTYGLSIAPPPGTTNGGAGANYSSSPSAARRSISAPTTSASFGLVRMTVRLASSTMASRPSSSARAHGMGELRTTSPSMRNQTFRSGRTSAASLR
jgi:hypothetical protein